MNSFSFEDKDPQLTRLKPGLALGLLRKGLFYERAMAMAITYIVSRICRKLSRVMMFAFTITA